MSSAIPVIPALPLQQHLPTAGPLAYGCMGLSGGWDRQPWSDADVDHAQAAVEARRTLSLHGRPAPLVERSGAPADVVVDEVRERVHAAQVLALLHEGGELLGVPDAQGGALLGGLVGDGADGGAVGHRVLLRVGSGGPSVEGVRRRPVDVGLAVRHVPG